MSMKDMPDICPLSKKSPTIPECATCCYMGYSHFSNWHWCKADRWDKGLPDVRG